MKDPCGIYIGKQLINSDLRWNIFCSGRLHDAVHLLHFNFAAGIYRQARSRSSRQEYSPISLSWKSCKITRVSFILLFEDRLVYSYPPEGQITVVDDGRRPLGGSLFTYLTNQLVL